MDKHQLIDTGCGECGRHLGAIHPKAQARCPTCGKWSKAGSTGPDKGNRGTGKRNGGGPNAA